MKIVDLQTTVVGTPWRELTFLELETDSGLVGLGEVRMVNKTDTLLACIRELAPRYVVGTDPFDIERLAWNIQVAEYGRPGEVAMSALAAFEVACWIWSARRSACRSGNCSAARSGAACPPTPTAGTTPSGTPRRWRRPRRA